MAAHPEQLRNRLEEAAAEMLTKNVDIPNRKKSSHSLVSIKAPPNTARQEKSAESVKSGTPTPARTPLTPTLKKANKVDSELRFIHRHGSGDHEEIEFHDRPVLQQRIGSLLRRRIHTDVIFKVGKGQDLLEAHRLILSSASRVFEQLFYGEQIVEGQAIEEEKMVRLEPEFTLIPFEVFLTAIYTNDIPLGLSLPMALEVFYAAKKYEVAFLQRMIIDHVAGAVTTVNVFEALNISTRVMELTSIIPSCWKIIEEETRAVLEHHLETIEIHALGRILDRDVLNLSEVELFQYLVRWAVVQCKKKGIKTTGRSKRQMMEPLLKHIRFTTMDPNTIKELIVPARVLDSRETSAIMCHLTGSDHQNQKVPLPYKTTPRRIPFSKQPQFQTPAVTSVDGLFNELILDYGTEPDFTPCIHKKKFVKKQRQKSKHVKRPPHSQR